MVNTNHLAQLLVLSAQSNVTLPPTLKKTWPLNFAPFSPYFLLLLQ